MQQNVITIDEAELNDVQLRALPDIITRLDTVGVKCTILPAPVEGDCEPTHITETSRGDATRDRVFAPIDEVNELIEKATE